MCSFVIIVDFVSAGICIMVVTMQHFECSFVRVVYIVCFSIMSEHKLREQHYSTNKPHDSKHTAQILAKYFLLGKIRYCCRPTQSPKLARLKIYKLI